MSLKKSIYSFYFLNMLVIPLGFIIRIFYSHTLSLAEFGLIYAIITFFTFMGIFTKVGLDQSIVYFLPKYIVKKDYDKIRNSFFSVFIILLTINIVFSIIMIFLADFLTTYYFKQEGMKNIFLILLLYFTLSNIMMPISQFFLSLKKVVYSQILYSLRLLLILIFSGIFFLIGFENLILYYSFSWALSAIIMISAYLFILWKKFPYLNEKKPKLDIKIIKQFLTYGFYGMFNGIGNLIILQIDIILIMIFFTTTEVGIYSNSIATISILFLLITPISILFLPLFSEYKENKDYKLMKQIINILYKYGFYLIFPISLIFFIYPETLLTMFFGEEFVDGASFLQIFALFSIFKILFQYNVNFMKGLGLIKKTTIITFTVAIFNIIFNLIMIYFVGIWGVALVTGISWLFLFSATLYFVKKEIELEINLIPIIKSIFLSFFFLILIYILKHLINTQYQLFNIFLTLGISFSIYLIFGYLLKIYTLNEFYSFLPEKIKNIVKIKK